MTFEEACRAPGFEEPPAGLSLLSQQAVIATAERLSEGGTTPIDPKMANLCRAQIEEFA